MKTVYILMYKKDDVMTPYAVFEDSITAERMKRDGDEMVTVPFFEDPTERALQAIERCKEEKPQLVEPWRSPAIWCKDGTLAPPYNTYPKVTCNNKTVDEHKWTNRSD